MSTVNAEASTSVRPQNPASASWTQDRTRALHAWTPSQRERLGALLAALCKSWALAWSGPGKAAGASEEVNIETSADLTSPEACWHFDQGSGAGDPMAAFGRLLEAPDAQVRQAVARWLFSVTPGTPVPVVAQAVADAAWTDWQARLVQLVGGLVPCADLTHVQPSASATDAWHGTLVLRWPWCGGQFHLSVPGDTVRRVLDASAPVASPSALQAEPKVSLREAIADRTVTLQVRLDGVELSLGQLQKLQLDDIVLLRHALDAPAQVFSADASHLCDGWLGQQQGQVAIELTLPIPVAAGTSPVPQRPSVPLP